MDDQGLKEKIKELLLQQSEYLINNDRVSALRVGWQIAKLKADLREARRVAQ